MLQANKYIRDRPLHRWVQLQLEPTLEAGNFRCYLGPVAKGWAGNGELGWVCRWGCRSQEILDLQWRR